LINYFIKMDTKKRLLKKLVDRKGILKISQKDLSEDLAISQGQLSSLLNGHSDFTLAKFIIVCERLGLDIQLKEFENDLDDEEKQNILEEIIELASQLKDSF
jgi:transcriptional regulator with XRE-family HTH domain